MHHTMQGVQIWGDSILKGVIWDDARKRYCILRENAVALCKDVYAFPIENHARMGCTVRWALEDLQETAPKELQNQWVLLELGGNDCDFHWEQVAETPLEAHLPITPLPIYEQTLETMVGIIRKAGGMPVLATLPPLDATRYLAWAAMCAGVDPARILTFLGDAQHMYRWQEAYSLAAMRTASRCGCMLLDLRAVFLAQKDPAALLCVDGIHPNAQAHQEMARVIQSAIC
ncbi:MAG: SGNH/GDSL hydrolase family protein [Clostridia bacterium]